MEHINPVLKSDLYQTLESWCAANFSSETFPNIFISDDIPLLLTEACEVVLKTLVSNAQTAEYNFHMRMHQIEDEMEEVGVEDLEITPPDVIP